MVQEILVILTFLAAVFYIVQKFFWKKPASKKVCGSENTNCGCH
ncbi:FeoB-associated Cys-rich membrane protein [Mesonia sp. K7]|nr:FeoB-associated Cys-rich membrane protein [Mesonia sp. K7]